MVKTAIDFLMVELLKNQTFQHDDYVTIELSHEKLKSLINTTKEMEKDQIENSYFDGCSFETNLFGNNPSEYYDKNYNK